MVLRSTLHGADDGSVVLVAIGLATNLLDLLKIPVGVQLVTSKVSALVAMGGRQGGGYEWNFAADGWGAPGHDGVYAGLSLTTQLAFSAWPQSVPAYILPFETGVHVNTGHVLSQLIAPFDEATDSPCRRAYRVYCGTERGRSSWDPMAVLFAARGNASNEFRIEAGREVFFEDGKAFWEPSSADPSPTNQYLLTLHDGAGADVEHLIDDLLLHVPDHRPSPPPSPPPHCQSWCQASAER